MAESQVDYCKSGTSSDVLEREKHKEDENVPAVPECAVCLQQCIHPARLPCNHVFCFLCVKGVANQSKRCPMCRQEIPPDFLERPQLVELEQLQQKEAATAVDEATHEEYQWFYEGRNGWWQYDQRTSQELETAYKQGNRNCELLIAGFLYIADFSSMIQYRRNDPVRRRRIKRDLYNAPKKGVAGIRLNNPVNGEQQEEPQQEMVREIRGAERPASPASDNTGDGTSTPIPPSNTPQTPATGTTSGDATPSNVGRLISHQRADSLHQIIHYYPGFIKRRAMPRLHQMRNLFNTFGDRF